MIAGWIAAVGPGAKVAWGFVRRFWLPIVVAIAVVWIVGTFQKVGALEAEVASQKKTIAVAEGIVERAGKLRRTIVELEEANRDLAVLVDAISASADLWEAMYAEAEARPPAVRIEYRDRVDPSSAETMAESGAKIASEIAEAVRVRSEGGTP
jgi:hypothetical protein